MWGDEKKIRVQAGNLHVCVRGNNRNNVFYVDAERIAFLRHCQRAAIKTNTVIEQFAIMDNHAHLQLGLRMLLNL